MSSLSPQEALNELDKIEQIKESRQKKLIDEEKKLEEESKRLQRYIYDKANPNPWILGLILVIIIVVIWILYLAFVKPSMSGEWYDENNRIWQICHNKLSDSLRITIFNDRDTISTHGDVVGNLFKCGDVVGIWNYNNVVLFIGGGGLMRVIG